VTHISLCANYFRGSGSTVAYRELDERKHCTTGFLNIKTEAQIGTLDYAIENKPQREGVSTWGDIVEKMKYTVPQ
jgi:hypothetical protein